MDLARIKHAIRGELGDPPIVGASDARWSVISSAADLYAKPTNDLVELLLTVAQRARSISLETLAERCGPDDARWVRLWPGEHYRLLAALAAELQPQSMIEIGTFRGQGALALAAGHGGAHVITYDVVPWDEIALSALKHDDFGGLFEQRIGDVGNARYLADQKPTLAAADLIFIDGPKDGTWEQAAIPPLLEALSDRRRLVVLDDIRLLEMVQLWRDLPYMKLDATSLGHWSGTGLLFTA